MRWFLVLASVLFALAVTVAVVTVTGPGWWGMALAFALVVCGYFAWLIDFERGRVELAEGRLQLELARGVERAAVAGCIVIPPGMAQAAWCRRCTRTVPHVPASCIPEATALPPADAMRLSRGHNYEPTDAVCLGCILTPEWSRPWAVGAGMAQASAAGVSCGAVKRAKGAGDARRAG